MTKLARSSAQLGNALRQFRKDRDLTQSELGGLINKRQATISNLEAAAGGTTLETLFAVLSALELELVVRPRTKGDTAQIAELF